MIWNFHFFVSLFYVFVCVFVFVFVFVWFACVCVFLCVSIILNEQVNDVAFSGIFEVEESHKKKNFFWPLYWGALFHREKTVMNPQNTKCHRSTKIIFFRHFWYFPITKAIHTYVLAKFKKISIFLFSTPLLDFYWRPLIKEALWKWSGQ